VGLARHVRRRHSPLTVSLAKPVHFRLAQPLGAATILA
jgi:hypothetical protein